jgi:hypothetical protein
MVVSSQLHNGAVQRTSVQLYRDCLRLVRHVAPGFSAKAVALRNTVRNEFRKKKDITDPIAIENAKADAVRALSNYLLATSARKDPKITQAMEEFHGRSVKTARQEQQNSNMYDNNKW